MGVLKGCVIGACGWLYTFWVTSFHHIIVFILVVYFVRQHGQLDTTGAWQKEGGVKGCEQGDYRCEKKGEIEGEKGCQNVTGRCECMSGNMENSRKSSSRGCIQCCYLQSIPSFLIATFLSLPTNCNLTLTNYLYANYPSLD